MSDFVISSSGRTPKCGRKWATIESRDGTPELVSFLRDR
jgi:hypothetical protein